MRRVQNKAGDPDPPVTGQKAWRPVGATAVVTSTVSAVVSSTKKKKKQARGRTAEEVAEMEQHEERYVIQRRHIWRMEPCECHRTCKCPSDGRLTYKRNEAYDCTRVPGTLSTYCYMFEKKALNVSVRQYSCYCRWCSRDEWSKCTYLDVVRHRYGKAVRPLEAGYRQWRNEGWRKVVITKLSAPDRAVTRVATQSAAAAKVYVNNLAIGATIACLTTENDVRHFWLASKQSKIKKAVASDHTSGVKKGEDVIDIVYYDRITDYKYRKVEYESIMSVASALVTVSGISWNRTTASRFYLGETTHNMLLDIARSVSEV